MKHAKLILFFTLVLVLSITSTNTSDSVGMDNVESEGIESPAIEFKLSYEDHPSITIVSDADFDTQAENEEWEGEGTEPSPYIIKGYNITDTNGGVGLVDAGIYISDISLYFELRDCVIIPSLPVSRTYGIYMENVTHSNVVNCTISNISHSLGVFSSSGSIVENCTITRSTQYAINFNTVHYGIIDDCVVYDCGDAQGGIMISNSEHCNITNNQVYDNGACAIDLSSGSDFCVISGNTLYDNAGVGIYLWETNNCTIQNNIAYDNSFEGELCGIYLTSSANCTILDNELYDNVFTGVNLYNSPNCDIVSNIIYNNSDHGIYGVLSENCTIIDNDIYENGFWGEEVATCGIAFGETTRWYIEGNTIWNNSANGIYCNDADFATIKDNVIFNNTDHGISGNWAYNVTVIGNTIYGNGWDSSVPEECGIYLYESDDWIIDTNIIYNNTDNGITLDFSHYNNITNNEIYDNAIDGVRGTYSDNNFVSNNTIYDNKDDGIDVVFSYNWTITHNIIYDHDDIGINLLPAAGCWIYHNDIGWNIENAYDSGNPGDNQWDDNISVGNWWHDWESGNYTVAGTYHINDTHAAKNMFVENATEMECESGTTGHNMIWTAFALNPDSYEFYVEEELFDSDTWDGSDIDIDVTGLDVGFHDVVLIVYHVSGHSLNGTSNVTVTLDVHSPTWNTTPSTPITVEFGEPFSYDVDASDPSGLDKWWLNDTSFAIDSNGVIANTTVLPVGDYGLIISVNDTLGYILTASITIQVRDTTDPVWDGVPQNQVLEFGESLSYQLNAIDLSVIGDWSVNDTANFVIDTNGLLTNSTALQTGVYVVAISVEDIHGNTLSIEITITVNDAPVTTSTTTTTTTTDTTAPIDPVLFLVMGLGGAGLIVVIVIIGVSKKKGS